MSKFRYSDDIPADLLPAIKRIAEPLEVLLPAWCHHVNIHCEHGNDTNEDANATVHTYYDYRWASIRLQPSWFAEKDERVKREDFAHELIHIMRSPVDDWALEIIKRIVPEDEASKFNGVLKDELRARAEMVTQDMTYMLLRLLPDVPTVSVKKKRGKADALGQKAWAATRKGRKVA